MEGELERKRITCSTSRGLIVEFWAKEEWFFLLLETVFRTHFCFVKCIQRPQFITSSGPLCLRLLFDKYH